MRDRRDVEVEGLMVRIDGNPAIDGSATIADRRLLQEKVQAQIDCQTDEKTQAVSKRTEGRAQPRHQTSDPLVEIPLCVESFPSAEGAAPEASVLGEVPRIEGGDLLSAPGTAPRARGEGDRNRLQSLAAGAVKLNGHQSAAPLRLTGESQP